MKPSERKRIARTIRSSMPSLYEKGRLLAATPRGRILRGIYLEDSSDPSRVYVWAFVQPLYEPASTITFNFGKRLGSPSKTWSVEDADALAAVVRDEGVPFFSPVSSPEAFATWSYLHGRDDFYALEAQAYSLVASGRIDDGVQVLHELEGSLSGGTAWMIEMRKRAERLAAAAETNPMAAYELLAAWESETLASLRVQDVP